MLTVCIKNKASFSRLTPSAGLMLLSVLIVLCAVGSIFIGTRDIDTETTWQALIAYDSTNTEHLLVHYLRVPRSILSVVVGAALGGAGAIMQALTRNPLAEPGLLGINAGATLAIVTGIAAFGISDTSQYMWFGIAGSALAGGAVYLLADLNHGSSPVKVVLAGTALSVVLFACTHIITLNSEEQVFDQFRHWVIGSLQGRDYRVLYPVLSLVICGTVMSLALVKELNSVSLGADVSRSLGIDQRKLWFGASMAIVILAGAATAAAGPVSFVGLTAPHIARVVAGSDYKWLLPYSMLISALLLVVADTLGRVIGYPNEISVGVMVALLGGPFFVFLVRRWKIAQL